jgi:hypothetical protein
MRGTTIPTDAGGRKFFIRCAGQDLDANDGREKDERRGASLPCYCH